MTAFVVIVGVVLGTAWIVIIIKGYCPAFILLLVSSEREIDAKLRKRIWTEAGIVTLGALAAFLYIVYLVDYTRALRLCGSG